MKKIILSALAIASISSASAKTSGAASHISLGPVVSLGHSWISGSSIDNKFKFAPAAGVGLVYSTNEHWGFGAQLLVSHEGFKQDYSNNTGAGTWAVNPVYLRVPLQAIYFFGDYGDRVRPKIYAGPSIAIKVDEHHFYSNEMLKPADNSPAAEDLYRTFDAGLTAGAGLNIRVSKATWLNLDAGYYHGLTSALNNYDYQNRNLRLTVGLMWGL